MLSVDLPAGAPAVFRCDERAIEVVRVTRGQAGCFPPQWQGAPGAYVLLGEPGRSRYRGYAGSAGTRGLPRRIAEGFRQREWAEVAVAVRRDTSAGFSAPQAAFLEALLFERLGLAAACERANGLAPVGMAVSEAEARWLAGLLDPVAAVIGLLGYDLSPGEPFDQDDEEGEPSIRVTVRDLIAAGLLRVGEELLPAWRGDGVPPARVLACGSLLWQDTVYESPSTPARLARGQKTSGYQYWQAVRPEGRVSLGALRDQYLAQAA